LENLKREGHLEDLDIGEKIIFDGFYGNELEKHGLDSFDSGQGPMPDCCEQGNETSNSIKGGEFLD
jgi:hypothetical protein